MATLNQKIIQWASGQVGKQIGAGECWDLANSAAKQAGAGTSSDFGPEGIDDDYVWGDEVDLKDVLPGDILQYRDWTMTTSTNVDVTFSDDSGWVDPTEAEVGHDHHTSIVQTNPGAGALKVLEQNDKGHHERVRSSSIRWKDAPDKVTSVRKPMKRQDNGKTEMALVVTTVSVTVTGTLTAYRPKKP